MSSLTVIATVHPVTNDEYVIVVKDNTVTMEGDSNHYESDCIIMDDYIAGACEFATSYREINVDDADTIDRLIPNGGSDEDAVKKFLRTQ